MPALPVADCAPDCLYRLADKPSKQYLIDAVDALASFVKVQRRKLYAVKSEQKRRAAAATQTSPAAGSSAPAFTFTVPPAPEAAGPAPDDERPETPPPPLEPVTPAPAPLFTFYTGVIPGPGAPGGTMYGGGIEDVD